MLDEGRLTGSKGRTVDFKNTVIIMTSNIGSDLIMEKMRVGTQNIASDNNQSEEEQKSAIIEELEKTTKKKEKKSAKTIHKSSPQSGDKTPLLDKACPVFSGGGDGGGFEISLENDLMPLLQKFFRPEFLNRLDDIIIFNPISSAMLRAIVDIQVAKFMQLIKDEKNISLILSDEIKDFLATKGWDPLFGARPLKRAFQHYLLDELAMEIIEGKILDGQQITVQVKGEKIEFKKK
jgi:ATP-dependent Clp protease ATP-binding subunit ClpA